MTVCAGQGPWLSQVAATKDRLVEQSQSVCIPRHDVEVRYPQNIIAAATADFQRA